MAVFAVFESSVRKTSPRDSVDEFIFLRDRFSLAAFVFGPLWMIWRRLWLVLIIYLVALGTVEFGLRRFGISLPTQLGVHLLISLLLGLEAANLRRWILIRRGWRDRGIVVADDLESAEHRFFDAKLAAKSAAKATAPQTTSYSPVTGGGRDILGLFPEPGGNR